jgi:hypothetical protein
MKRKIISTLIFAGLMLACLTAGANAATITVTNAADPDNTSGACATGGSCTIRQAINTALDGDAIVFNLPAGDCPNGVCTLNLLQGGLTIKRNVAIVGPGAKNLIIKKADILFPFGITMLTLFPEAGVPATIKISGVSIVGGSSQGTGGIAAGNTVDVTLDGVAVSNCGGTFAGGISNTAIMTIINSTISGNGGATGGIYNAGIMTIANSTISGNQGTDVSGAGGILNFTGEKSEVVAVLNLNNVSIINNSETNSTSFPPGGVNNSGGIVNIRNTVIAENHAPGGAPDALGSFTSQGSNFLGSFLGTNGFGNNGFYDITGSAELLILGDNGGQTMTHAMLSISPLIDHGDNCVINRTCAVNNPPVTLRFDQRGPDSIRNWGKTIDIGAFEFQQPSANAP